MSNKTNDLKELKQAVINSHKNNQLLKGLSRKELETEETVAEGFLMVLNEKLSTLSFFKRPYKTYFKQAKYLKKVRRIKDEKEGNILQ